MYSARQLSQSDAAEIEAEYATPKKRYVLLRELTFSRLETGSEVTIACVIPHGNAGKRLLAAAVADAAKTGKLLPVFKDATDRYELSQASNALLAKLGVPSRRKRDISEAPQSPVFRFLPAGYAASLQPMMQTVYAYAVGGTMMVNVDALLSIGGSGGMDPGFKGMLTADDDFCFHVEQAAIALTEAAADLANELTIINDEWAAVDSLLETARCECVVGSVTLPWECMDFWIREKMTPAGLVGDDREADSLARISNSRAQINFDPTDATKTVVRVNSTVRVSGGDTVVYQPLPVLSSPGSGSTSWVVSTQTADSTITLRFHLLNPACTQVNTLPCVAIDGTAVVTRLPSGGVPWSVNRDAFPMLAYFSKTGTTGCSFTTNFVAEARNAPFNLGFLSLLPFMPNQLIDGERPELDNPCNISEA